jgi:hypothetical protein
MRILSASSLAVLILLAAPSSGAADELTSTATPAAVDSLEAEKRFANSLKRLQDEFNAKLSRDLDERLAERSALSPRTGFSEDARAAAKPSRNRTSPVSLARRGDAGEPAATRAADTGTAGRMHCTQAAGKPLACRILAERPSWN